MMDYKEVLKVIINALDIEYAIDTEEDGEFISGMVVARSDWGYVKSSESGHIRDIIKELKG